MIKTFMPTALWFSCTRLFTNRSRAIMLTHGSLQVPTLLRHRWFFCPNEVKWKSISCVRLFEPHGPDSPWNSPGQNTGMGSVSLLQGIFPTQGSNPGHPHYRRILSHLSHQGSPFKALQMPDFSCKLHSSLEEKCVLVSNHCINRTVSLKIESADALIYSMWTQSWSNPDTFFN